MKLYVYNITQSEKMVYLSCVRNIKKGNKFDVVPTTISLKKENFHIDKVKFPFIIDAEFKKGIGAEVKLHEES